MATRKFNWGFPAMIALLVVAVVTFLDWLLFKFGGSWGEIGNFFNTLVGIIMNIARIIGYVFIGIYAYDWAAAQRKRGWIFTYWICVIIVLVFVILGWR